MLGNTIKVNSRIIVALASQADVWSNSRIECIDRDSISILMPSRQGMPMPVSKNSRLIVAVFSDTGRVHFESHVIGLLKEHIRMLKIALPVAYEQTQSRQFYRVPVYIRVPVYFASLESLEAGQELETETAFIENISGGGAGLLLDNTPECGSSLVIDCTKSSIGLGMVDGKVVRIAKDRDKGYVGREFAGLSGGERDRLVS